MNGATTYSDINKVFADQNALVQNLKNDPLMKLFSALREGYMTSTDGKVSSLQQQIDANQKKFMAQQMETDKDRKFFPDANSTLRVTYGKVAGSNPRDALYYGYQTHLSGVIEKYIPGDYEFDLPKKLIELYNKKDYGIYKNSNGDVPVNFTATNHTTGGLDHLHHVGAIQRGAAVARVGGGEADLVVDDEMDGAAGAVAARARHGEAFGDHALAGEGGVAVQQHGDHRAAGDLGVAVAELDLLGARLAQHHRVDGFEVRGVRGERQVDAVAVEGAVG